MSTSRPFPDPLQGFLFDMDGTLVDSEALHFESTNRILAEFGANLSEAEFQPYIGMAEEPFWQDLIRRFALPLPALELAQRRTEALAVRMQSLSLPPLPGVLPLLQRIQAAGLPCGVASSSPRAMIEQTLECAGLTSFFQGWWSGHEDVVHGKPAPDLYRKAAAALKLKADRCVAVEDSATGLASAKAAGLFTVAIPCPSHPDPKLHGADRLLHSCQELLEAVQDQLSRDSPKPL
ncbi:MAG: HAD family phosphatase [Planctomycetota bacterium]|nr:MAG: HAD family phosphatase [Planctomycetota bacterium]